MTKAESFKYNSVILSFIDEELEIIHNIPDDPEIIKNNPELQDWEINNLLFNTKIERIVIYGLKQYDRKR